MHVYTKYLLYICIIINPRHACAARFTVVVLCVCVCVCLSVRPHPNLQTDASRHQTQGTSGTSGLHASKIKRCFSLKCLVRKLECLLSTAINVHHFVSLQFFI